MNSNAIRAGKAFVEMFMTDDRVDAVLKRVETKLKSFGAAVDQVGHRSFSSMETAATASTAATGTQIGLLSSGMLFLQAAVGTVARTFNFAFARITSSVGKATMSIGALTYLVNGFAKGSKLEGYLDGFLRKSQQTEATGRWTRFWGTITGSNQLREVGFRLERLGMGASIVKGFKSAGITGALTASVGVAYRSAQGIAIRGAAGLIASPFRMAFTGARSVVASFVPQLDRAKNSADGTTTSMTRTAGAARVLSTSSFSLGRAIGGLSLKLAGFAAILLGPALGASKSFVTSAQEMVKESEKTGQSLQDLINQKYGSNSLISPSDIQAAADLGDLMKVLKTTVAAAWAQIGAAALPTLTEMTQKSLEWANIVVRLLHDNRQLISTVVRIAATVATVAAVLGAASTVLLALGTAASVILNPLTLVAGGIAAIAYAFPELRDEALGVFGWLFGNFGELSTVVSETMQAVQDALMGGNLKAAASVLWTGLRLAWLTGTEQLRDVWRVLTNNIASFGVNAFSGLRKAWVETTRFLGDAWQVVMDGMRTAWKGTQNWFAKGFATVIAKMSGQDVNDVLQTINEMQQQENRGHDDAFAQQMLQREQLANQRLADIETERQAMQDGLTDELEGRRTAAQAELEALQRAFKVEKENAAKLRPELRAAVDGPGKKKKAEKERERDLISSADIRSQEGLADVVKSLFGGDKAAETAANTKQANTLLGTVNAKLDRSNNLLDRIHRDAGNDVVSLSAVGTAA